MIVAVLNRAPGLDDRDLAFFVEAWNLQAREIADVHGCEYTPVVLFGTAEGVPGADARALTIKTDIQTPGAAGFHDDDLGVVFAEVQFSSNTSIVGSHEVAEEMRDPMVNLWAPFDPDHEQAYEIADRCEGDSYVQQATVLGETRPIRVNNYLLPSAFDPAGVAPFDRMGLLKTWNGMTSGGYCIVRDISSGKIGNIFAARRALPRIVSGPAAGAALAEKLAKRGSRLLRRLRG